MAGLSMGGLASMTALGYETSGRSRDEVATELPRAPSSLLACTNWPLFDDIWVSLQNELLHHDLGCTCGL